MRVDSKIKKEIVEDYQKNYMSFLELYDKYKIHTKAIGKILDEYGIERDCHKRLRERREKGKIKGKGIIEVKDEIMEDYNNGMNTYDIAAKYCYSASYIRLMTRMWKNSDVKG